MNTITITGTLVNHTTSRFARGPEWSGNHAMTGAPRVTATRDPTITSVTISIRTVTEIIEGIAATIHSEEKDALITQITEIYGN